WTNIKNKHLLETVLLSSEGKPYIWKAIDISSEYKNYQEVINKTKSMLLELEVMNIKVCTIVTDSAGIYVAASTSTQTTQSNNIDSLQNEYLGKDNKETEDNEECNLTYISETEFSEEKTDIIEDQDNDNFVELDNSVHLAIDKNKNENYLIYFAY
ncbi:14118_t:CDS:2, partial [Dentiscutata heterogama]